MDGLLANGLGDPITSPSCSAWAVSRRDDAGRIWDLSLHIFKNSCKITSPLALPTMRKLSRLNSKEAVGLGRGVTLNCKRWWFWDKLLGYEEPKERLVLKRILQLLSSAWETGNSRLREKDTCRGTVRTTLHGNQPFQNMLLHREHQKQAKSHLNVNTVYQNNNRIVGVE